MSIVSFLVCLALSFASGALFAWGTGSRRGGPNISESNGPGGPIISGDPSLHDMTTFMLGTVQCVVGAW